MKGIRIQITLVCESANECLTKIREVLEPIEQVRDHWPSAAEWERVLPHWFVSSCATPMSADEARVRLEHWRKMSRQEQVEAVANERWSLSDWLYWMEPAQRVWSWVSATPIAQGELQIVLAVDGWPVALGAFDWLVRAAGATEITRLS